MTERPIIFSAPMVQAILAGRKSQTRRVLGPGTTLFDGGGWTKAHKAQMWDWAGAWVDPGPSPAGNPGPYLKLPWLAGDRHDVFEGTVHRIYPVWQPGDRLWVKETWTTCEECGGMEWYADANVGGHGSKTRHRYCRSCDHGTARWRSPRFMPRWASRLTLLVTAVRVQRLKEISEEDAIAEGMLPQWGPTAAFAFRRTWESLHGPGSWEANPWVAAISFEVAR